MDNSNPTLPRGAEEPDEPEIKEPPDLQDFSEEIRKRFRESSAEYVVKLESYRPKPTDGVETIFSQFNEMAEAVEGTGTFTASMLRAKFRALLPPNIQALME